MAHKSSDQLSLADGLVHPRIGANEGLQRIDALIDWSRIEAELSCVRQGQLGPPTYPGLMMFKALLLQQWYQLSDPGLEQALSDRISFRRFVHLSLQAQTPDHTTLWRFRQLLKEGLEQRLFAEINRQLEAQGLLLKQGTLIDASLVQADATPPDAHSGRASADPDARWAKKNGKLTFGYKAHIGVDQDSQLIRRAELTPANVNDTVMAEALISGDESAVYADMAYDTQARRAALKARGIRPRIMHRPNKHHPVLASRLQRRNALIAAMRRPVERLFGLFKRHYGFRRMRYYNLARNHARLVLMCMAVNLRRMLVLTG